MIAEGRVRDALQLGPYSIDGTVLLSLRDQAVAFIERQTHRYFGSVMEAQVVLKGNGTRNLQLPNAAVDPEYVSVVEQEYEGASATLLGYPDDFAVRPLGTTSWLARKGGAVWASNREYVITYDHGFVEDEGPKDVEALVVALVGRRLGEMGAEGKSSETIGGYSYTRAAIHAFEDGDMRSIVGAMRTLDYWRLAVWA